MKKIAIAFAFAAFASTASAAVSGGPHDLTVAANKRGAYGALADAGTTPCQFCHTPHKANPDAAYTRAPLWNRQSLTATFTMYDQAKLTAGNTVDASPNAASITCLTCHEGSAAMGQTYAQTASLLTGGTDTAITDVGMLRVGTNLNDDHPVSFLYPTGGAGEFPAGTATAVAGLPLYSSKVECATCHDPHLTAVLGSNLLRASAATICGLCHTQK